jgi:hypothetical protein
LRIFCAAQAPHGLPVTVILRVLFILRPDSHTESETEQNRRATMLPNEFEIRAHIDRLEDEADRILATRALAEIETRNAKPVPGRQRSFLADVFRHLLFRPLAR